MKNDVNEKPDWVKELNNLGIIVLTKYKDGLKGIIFVLPNGKQIKMEVEQYYDELDLIVGLVGSGFKEE
jgi:hypothetical protein